MSIVVEYELTYRPRPHCPTCHGRFPLNSGGAGCPACQRVHAEREDLKAAIREVLVEMGFAK